MWPFLGLSGRTGSFILMRLPTPHMLCVLLFHGDRSSRVLHTACSARAPAVWPYFCRMNALIYGLKLLALVLFSEDRASSLGGAFCWIYLDNNNFLAALVRGDSNTGVIASLVARFWQLVQRLDICAWPYRAHSDLSIDDLPARGRKLPFRPMFGDGFHSFRTLFARCRAMLAVLSDP